MQNMNQDFTPKKVSILSVIGWIYVITGFLGLFRAYVIWREPGLAGLEALSIYPMMAIGVFLGSIFLFLAKLDKEKRINKKTRIIVVSLALLIILINFPYILDSFK